MKHPEEILALIQALQEEGAELQSLYDFNEPDTQTEWEAEVGRYCARWFACEPEVVDVLTHLHGSSIEQFMNPSWPFGAKMDGFPPASNLKEGLDKFLERLRLAQNAPLAECPYAYRQKGGELIYFISEHRSKSINTLHNYDGLYTVRSATKPDFGAKVFIFNMLTGICRCESINVNTSLDDKEERLTLAVMMRFSPNPIKLDNLLVDRGSTEGGSSSSRGAALRRLGNSIASETTQNIFKSRRGKGFYLNLPEKVSFVLITDASLLTDIESRRPNTLKPPE